MKNTEKLLYWIHERESIRKKKEAGEPKPWSEDKVFQTVYFCNVKREYDKVTKFIREMYSPMVHDKNFELNIILSRFINWPDTLNAVGYLEDWDPSWVRAQMNMIKNAGWKVWGNAYVVTTHGIAMDKIDYLCDRVMPRAEAHIDAVRDNTTCRGTARSLMNMEGISTFMAGQVVADLKNTKGHTLYSAEDWWSFALPGPGSRRGMNWLYERTITDHEWLECLLELQEVVEARGWVVCAQDLQNCLCEFDKYMRVSTGKGRSKRSYNGIRDMGERRTDSLHRSTVVDESSREGGNNTER